MEIFMKIYMVKISGYKTIPEHMIVAAYDIETAHELVKERIYEHYSIEEILIYKPGIIYEQEMNL